MGQSGPRQRVGLKEEKWDKEESGVSAQGERGKKGTMLEVGGAMVTPGGPEDNRTKR